MDTKVIDRTGTAVRARELTQELSHRALVEAIDTPRTPSELALHVVRQLLNEGRP